jgi:hypothetical protein
VSSAIGSVEAEHVPDSDITRGASKLQAIEI